MKKTVKVQHSGTNITISLPKDFADKLIIKNAGVQKHSESPAFLHCKMRGWLI